MEQQPEQRSLYEIYKEQAEHELEKLTQEAFERYQTDATMFELTDEAPHKVYINSRPELL